MIYTSSIMGQARDRWLHKPELFSYVGGKTRMSGIIADVIGEIPKDLIDPFFGAGSVPMLMCRMGEVGNRIIAQEASNNIIDVWNTAKRHGSELLPKIKEIYDSYEGIIDREKAKELAAKYNDGISDPVERVATFIILSRHSFNRNLLINTEGKITAGFQNPRWGFSGSFPPGMEKRLSSAIHAIQDCDIIVSRATHNSWVNTIRNSEPCDVVFLDPPYVGREYIKYPGEAEVGAWTSDDTRELIKEAKRASMRGVKIIMTNSPMAREIMEKAGFDIVAVVKSGGGITEPTDIIGVLEGNFKAQCLI